MMKALRPAGLVDMALACGAAKAAEVPGSAVALDALFRKYCEQNACGTYGRRWTCPPAIGEVYALMERVRAYPKALLYQTVWPLQDSFDWEGMARSGEAHTRVSLALHARLGESLSPGFLHLSRGGCGICEKCAMLEAMPCRNPDSALGAMEGYGIDVSKTAIAAGMPYASGPDTVTYFGIVLYGA